MAEVEIPDGILETVDLDYLLDEGVNFELLIGRKVYWHSDDTVGTLERTPHGDVHLKLEVGCGWCEKAKTYLYLGPGLHAGAWAYCYDPDTGEYLANLRDQSWKCPDCQEKAKAT